MEGDDTKMTCPLPPSSFNHPGFWIFFRVEINRFTMVLPYEELKIP
jgi:hypothetical protein